MRLKISQWIDFVDDIFDQDFLRFWVLDDH
jgi:hypothetical protein